jgi:HSP20 family molecular chaperone IbpA
MNSIAANYRDGILEIEIPKLEEAKPKQIQINVGTPAKAINA